MRRHDIAVRFRQEYGDEAWGLLRRLMREEPHRYKLAIESIERGRAKDVANHLGRWALECPKPASAVNLVAGPAQAPPRHQDPVIDIWQQTVSQPLGASAQDTIRQAAHELGLYGYSVGVLAEAAARVFAAKQGRRLELVAWAAEADAATRQPAPPAADINWRAGSRHAAEQMRRNPTDSERELAAFLAEGVDGLTFRAQEPVGRFIADFLCDQLPIVIEVDGESHVGREDRDYARDVALAKQGYITIRVPASDLGYRTELVDTIRGAAQQMRDGERRQEENARIVQESRRGLMSFWVCLRCPGKHFWSAGTSASCRQCGREAQRTCRDCRRTAAISRSARCYRCNDARAVARRLGR